MSRFQGDPSFEKLKTIVGVLLGLACLLGGWMIFSANGFYIPIIFLAGALMMPLGVLVLGTSITGGLGEEPPQDVNHIRQDRDKEY